MKRMITSALRPVVAGKTGKDGFRKLFHQPHNYYGKHIISSSSALSWRCQYKYDNGINNSMKVKSADNFITITYKVSSKQK